MGMLVQIACSTCGYESEELRLGTGMLMLSEHVVGVCSACRRFTSMESAFPAAVRRLMLKWQDPGSAAKQEDPPGDCSLCQTKGSVRPATAAPLSGWEAERALFEKRRMHRCPQCGEFTARERMVGLWD